MSQQKLIRKARMTAFQVVELLAGEAAARFRSGLISTRRDVARAAISRG